MAKWIGFAAVFLLNVDWACARSGGLRHHVPLEIHEKAKLESIDEGPNTGGEPRKTQIKVLERLRAPLRISKSPFFKKLEARIFAENQLCLKNTYLSNI